MRSRREDPGERSHPTVVGEGGPAEPRRLLVFLANAVETHLLPDHGTLVVGRSKDCEIRLDHPSISRRHAKLRLGVDTVEVEELGSSNGSRLAGVKLEVGKRLLVPAGAVLELGSIATVVRHGEIDAKGDDAAATPHRGAAPALGAGEGPMASVDRLLERLSVSALSVVLLGETGAGKTVVAERIHRQSKRAKGPFVPINCAALPEQLLESELFGHEKGAFTGAVTAKAGLLESADHGTLFFDEVGELPLATQAKLLHVLESGQVSRLGSLRPRAVDVRFLSATNRDLESMVAAGSFRRDLYFRLNGLTVVIPPLRERRDEILKVAEQLLGELAARQSMPKQALSKRAEAALLAHAWPGNLRELKNTIERASLLAERTIEQEHLGFGARAPDATAPSAPLAAAEPSNARSSSSDLKSELEDIERRRIEEALAQTHGNQTLAAELLGISRRTLLNRLDAYSLPRPRRDRR